MRSQSASYHGYRFPPDLISHAVWLYHRFCLSFRDVEDLLAQRGVTVTYETIRQWLRQVKPGGGGSHVVRPTWRKPPEGTQQVKVLPRQRLATSRNRVLRGPGVNPAAKRTQGTCRPRDGAPKGI